MNSREIDLTNEPSFPRESRECLPITAVWSWPGLRHEALRFAGYLGGIFFVPAAHVGVLFWLALVQSPRLTLFALLGLILANGLLAALQVHENLRTVAIVNANALLAAIGIAWLTGAADLTPTTQLLLLSFVVALTVMVSAASLRGLLGTSLPPLTLGYSLILGTVFTLFPDWVQSAAQATPAYFLGGSLQNWLLTFLQSLGAVLYQPNPLVGLVIGAVLLYWSRTMFVTGLVGWIAGIFTAVSLSSLGVHYLYILSAHNYFFSGLAVGSVLFLPGRMSLVRAAAAGSSAALFAALVQYLLGGSGFAFLPLPSILTIWLAIGVLAPMVEQRTVVVNDRKSLPPEEAWWLHDYWAERAGHPDPYVGVPVAGEVEIVQGFEGKFSHRGPWRHALDFQRPASDIGESEYLRSTWGTPVYAPMAGFVEMASDKAADNQPGMCNYAENWGNYVVIRLDHGGWLLLGHFRRGTIAVGAGARVVEGDYLGEIGNSGRSPFPHLHLQVQNSPKPGAPTIPFRLANYLTRDPNDVGAMVWNASGVPAEGTLLKVAPRNPQVFQILAGVSPGIAYWHVEAKGAVPACYRNADGEPVERIDISLDDTGRHVFKSVHGEFVVISVDYDAWRVVESKPGRSSVLRLLSLASTAVPHAAVENMSWREPLLVHHVGWLELLQLSLAPLSNRPHVYAASRCRTVPGVRSRNMTIETKCEDNAGRYPDGIVSEWAPLRGPVRLDATFADGSLSLTLQSFEPRFSVHQYDQSAI